MRTLQQTRKAFSKIHVVSYKVDEDTFDNFFENAEDLGLWLLIAKRSDYYVNWLNNSIRCDEELSD